jgi:hypothetical protein
MPRSGPALPLLRREELVGLHTEWLLAEHEIFSSDVVG